VLGLGEALVGNYPGKALSFTCRKGRDEPRVLSFRASPSASSAVASSSARTRTVKTSRDLRAPGFTTASSRPRLSAGLWITHLAPDRRRTFRRNLLIKLAAIGKAVEQAAGYPQDIEGAYAQGVSHVVQTRPQVGLERR